MTEVQLSSIFCHFLLLLPINFQINASDFVLSGIFCHFGHKNFYYLKKNYAIPNKKMLAVVKFVEHGWYYLEDAKFFITFKSFHKTSSLFWLLKRCLSVKYNNFDYYQNFTLTLLIWKALTILPIIYLNV